MCKLLGTAPHSLDENHSSSIKAPPLAPLLSSKSCTGYPSRPTWLSIFLTKKTKTKQKKTEGLLMCGFHTEISSTFWITAMKRWEQPGFTSILSSLWCSLVPEGSGKRLHTPSVLLLFPFTSAILSHPQKQGAKTFNLHRMPQMPISGILQYSWHILAFKIIFQL